MCDTPLTILHISDIQFGLFHRFYNKRLRFGNLSLQDQDIELDTLLSILVKDVRQLCSDFGPDGLRSPQVVVVTGDLAEWGRREEFADVLDFLVGMSEKLDIPRKHFVIVPGNHDINRNVCGAHVTLEIEEGKRDRSSDPESECLYKDPPTQKWMYYGKFFQDFYGEAYQFTQEQPWTLFEMSDLKLVVAGLNSTIDENHYAGKDVDKFHYGYMGKTQMEWFAEKLKQYQQKGWFRIAALHHNLDWPPDSSPYKDVDYDLGEKAQREDRKNFESYLKPQVNIVMHGHVHKGKADTDNQPLIFTAGSLAVTSGGRPEGTRNQYQLLQFFSNRFLYYARGFDSARKAWIGDTTACHLDKGHYWNASVDLRVPFKDVTTLPEAIISSQPIKKKLTIEKYLGIIKDKYKYPPIKVSNEFSHVPPMRLKELYLPLRASIDPGNSCYNTNDVKKPENNLKEINLLGNVFEQALNHYSRQGLLILGDRGSGMTAYLHRLIVACCINEKRILGSQDPVIVPVFLPLGTLRDSKRLNLPTLIEKSAQELVGQRECKVSDFWSELSSGKYRLLLLLDGLDETGDSFRLDIANWIREITASHAKILYSIVLTCCYSGYTQEVHDTLHKNSKSLFLRLHLRALSQRQSIKFIYKWYASVEKNQNPDADYKASAQIKAKVKTKDLLRQISGPEHRSKRMYEMIGNPFYLHTICLVHYKNGSKGLGLISSRSSLYRECVNALIGRQENPDSIIDAFGAIAFRMHQHGVASIALDSLKQIVSDADYDGGDSFLQGLLGCGLLISNDSKNYSFSHFGFQEYLAACRLLSQDRKNPSNKHFETTLLQHSQKIWPRIGQENQQNHIAVVKQQSILSESWWQEVILLSLSDRHPGEQNSFVSLYNRYIEMLLDKIDYCNRGNLLRLIFEETSATPSKPFLAKINQPAGTDKKLWQAQLKCLKILKQFSLLNEVSLHEKTVNLRHHPWPDIRQWIEENIVPVHQPQANKPEHIVTPSGLCLIKITGGDFYMGSTDSDERGYGNEKPRHKVQIKNFYLGRYPVTNSEYKVFLEANPEIERPEYLDNADFNGDFQPVVGVSWEDARHFAEWAGGRLPTEAEWEYAARAGTVTRYWWGDEMAPDRANGGESQTEWSDRQTSDVRKFPANQFGLHDILGNVREWVEDDESPNYRHTPQDGSAWIAGMPDCNKIVRGGAWNQFNVYLRSAHRDGLPPKERNNSLGFRIAKDIS